MIYHLPVEYVHTLYTAFTKLYYMYVHYLQTVH